MAVAVQNTGNQDESHSIYCFSLDLFIAVYKSLSHGSASKDFFPSLLPSSLISSTSQILAVVFWQTYRALLLHNNRVWDLANGDELVNQAHRNRERKVLFAILFVLGLFYLTFAPQFVALNILIFHPWLRKVVGFRAFLYTSNKVLLVSSSINPFIYAWRIPKYRRALRAVFRRDNLPNRQINISLQNNSARRPRTADRPVAQS